MEGLLGHGVDFWLSQSFLGFAEAQSLRGLGIVDGAVGACDTGIIPPLSTGRDVTHVQEPRPKGSVRRQGVGICIHQGLKHHLTILLLWSNIERPDQIALMKLGDLFQGLILFANTVYTEGLQRMSVSAPVR